MAKGKKKKKSSKKSYAKVSWGAGELAILGQMTRGEAREFLSRNEQHIRKVMINAGWEAITGLLTCEQKEGDKSGN